MDTAEKRALKKTEFKNSRLDLLDRIYAPSLVAWVYQVQLGPAKELWLTSAKPDTARAEAVLTKLGNSTRLYYQPDTAKANFVKGVKAALDEMANANSFDALQRGHTTYKAAVARLKAFNASSAAALKEFVDEQKSEVVG